MKSLFLIPFLCTLSTQVFGSPISLTEVSFTSTQYTYQSSELWDPADWLGLTGVGTEDGFKKSSSGAKIITKASTFSYACVVCVWMFGKETSAYDSWDWDVAYQLNGDPGYRANVSIEWDLGSFPVGAAADGYSGGQTSLTFYAFGQDGHSLNTGYAFDLYMAGFTFSDDFQSGTIDFGTLTVGDTLLIGGYFKSRAKTAHYGPGVVASAMVGSWEYSIELTALPPLPVPEPPTVALLGLSLIGLVAARRRKQ